MTVDSPRGRGDGRLMTGLVLSSTPESVPPLLPRLINGIVGTSIVCENNNLQPTCGCTQVHIPVQLNIWNPDPDPDPERGL